MPAAGRVAKTMEKAQRGLLPAPTGERPVAAVIYDLPCDGCDEVIESTDVTACGLVVRGIMELRFHGECYTAWSTFTR